jgi:parallel beta-helix repeat protein
MTAVHPINHPNESSQKNSPSKIISLTISLLLLLTIFQTLLIHEVSSPPTTRIVPTPTYPTIQSAIDASKRGDIVQVNPGTYYEHLIVNVVNLLLKGVNKYTTIINGNGTGTPITLEASGITVTGFTITDANRDHDIGINSNTYSGHNITGNIIENMIDGVHLLQSDSNYIVGNTFVNNSMHAINIGISVTNQITDNTISESAYGIFLSATNSTQVLRNNISKTSFGIYSGNTKQNTFSNNTEQSNSCGIQTYRSDHLTINNNAITGGMYSMQLQRTSDSTIDNNTLTQASYGIYLSYSSSNTLGGTRCNLVNKNDWGIVVYNGTNNKIIDGNIIAENTWGISLQSSSNGNTIYRNNFFSNIRQAYQDLDSMNNFWWNTNTLEGNYWNDYSGYPPAEGVDYYPLTQPWPMRNLAITSVTPSKTQIQPGETITISVNVKNFGVILEGNVKVTAYYNTTAIETKTTTLAAGATKLLTYNWNTVNVPIGNYIMSAKAEPIPYVERNYADNTLNDGTVTILPVHDVAILDVRTSRTMAYAGYGDINIEVDVKNEGASPEEFHVTAHYNSSIIGTQLVTLGPEATTTLTFTWNTQGVTPSNYTISATADQVPGETHISDNTFIYGTVRIRIPGDVNGDNVVDIFDAAQISAHWYPGPPTGPLGYDPITDVDNDGNINIIEAGIVSANW